MDRWVDGPKKQEKESAFITPVGQLGLVIISHWGSSLDLLSLSVHEVSASGMLSCFSCFSAQGIYTMLCQSSCNPTSEEKTTTKNKYLSYLVFTHKSLMLNLLGHLSVNMWLLSGEEIIIVKLETLAGSIVIGSAVLHCDWIKASCKFLPSAICYGCIIKKNICFES